MRRTPGATSLGVIVTLSGRDAGREERLKACRFALGFIRFTVLYNVDTVGDTHTEAVLTVIMFTAMYSHLSLCMCV